MKHTTKVNDLVALVTLRQADQDEEDARQTFVLITGTRYPDPAKITVAVQPVHAAASIADAARADWMKRPLSRRDLATATHAIAEREARLSAHRGDTYSGDTWYRVIWGAAPAACTITSGGEQYSRGCTHRKTDAAHTVTLDPAGCPLLHDHRDGLVAASSNDGLPLIALYPLTTKEAREHPDTYRAVWVGSKGKQIEHVNGWISGDGTTCYHSTISAEHAREGYESKHAAHLDRLRERRRTRKEERRAALVARLCHGVTATLADAKALHYCDPGIQAFQARHGIGDSATLPELVRTGDPSAVNLALHIARQVRRNPRTTSAA